MAHSDQAWKSSGRFFRLNCRPAEIPAVDLLLKAEGFASSGVPLSRYARVLEHGPKPLGSSLAAFFGLIYIQDKSSFLPALCLNPEPGGVVLDMCASPGSKTGVLSHMVGPYGGILANEPNRIRLQTLRKNLQLQNLFNVGSTRYPGQDFPQLDGPVHILCDVPCSGWGTVDRHPKVRSMWTDERIGPLIELQQKILGRAACLLQPGSRLIYSTCTTNVRENEDQIAWAADTFGLEIEPLAVPGGIVTQPLQRQGAAGCFRVDGPRSGGQSFFIGCLGRPGLPAGPRMPQTDQREFILEKSLGAGLEGHEAILRASPVCWENLPPGSLELHQDEVFFVPAMLGTQSFSALTVTGFPLGRIKKGRFFLSQRTRHLVPAPGQQAELNLEDITSLHRLVQGQSLQVRFKGKLIPLFWRDIPLGWLSVKGTRGLWTDRG